METIIFPDHFPLSRLTTDSIKIVIDKDAKKAEELIKKDYPEYEVIKFEQDGESGYMALAGFHVYSEPGGSNSPGSKAKYLARSEDKNFGLLLQLMEPDCVTSHHYHALKTEIYHPLTGEANLMVNGKTQKLKSKESVVVNKNEPHQVQTDGKSAITLLEIIDDPYGLSMADHNYV